MAVDPIVDDITKARTDLLLSRMGFILLFGAVLYPLFFILDWHERPWDRAAAVVIRVAVTVLILALARLSRTPWGRPRALLLGSIGFLAGQAGFAAIIWHAKGFGSSNGDAFELFFGTYCVLVPATTGWAALEGIAMICIQLATYGLSGAPVHYDDVAWNAIPFFVIFLTGRHVANLVEIAWRREFVKRAALEDAIEQLRATQDKLVQSEKMAALGRLTAGVAHELKNPLFVIGTNLSVIQDAVDELGQTETPRSICEKLVDGAQRLRSALGRASFVSELLRQFSTPPNRRDAPTDVNAIVESSISLVAMTSRRKEIAVHREFEDLPPFECDPQSLSQVFVNLIENACDAVDEHGNVWVSTKTKPNGTIMVCVRDDGTGIAFEHLNRVTEPFFTTKEPGKGMGLGLAVATSIVERYGGNLALSDGNPGAIAVVTLPLKSQPCS
jgi:signal transduction histidine kinase